MKNSYFFALLLLGGAVYAQQDVNQALANNLNQVFALLEKNRVPTGLLLDYAVEFTDVPAYNGTLTDSTDINPGVLQQLYHTLFMSRIQDIPNGFIPPADWLPLWYNHRQNHNAAGSDNPVLALSGLYYQYSRFAPNALTAGKLQLLSNQFADKYTGGVWQNPYETKETFALSPPVSRLWSLELDVTLPAGLWFTNSAAAIAGLEVDFGDGNGYRPLVPGALLSLSYPAPGTYAWTYRLTRTSGAVLYCRSQLTVEGALKNAADALYKVPEESDANFSVTATHAYLGETGSVRLSINYAPGAQQLRNPLVVVEGLDVGTLLSPEDPYGMLNIDDFLQSIDNINSDLNNLLTGITQVYDVVYVDWENGVDHLQRNAYALEAVIHWVNANKVTNEPLVVLGQSMGGVIARYALRDMENRGEDHQVRLYISHDAPHQGANVPIAYQYLVRHALRQYVKAPIPFWALETAIPIITHNTATPLDYLTLADTPAARQMLINYIDAEYNLDNTQHDAWQAELQALGYPQGTAGLPIRNVAISNAAECGIPQGFNPGDYLFRFKRKTNPSFFGDILRAITNPLVGIVANEWGVVALGILPGHSKFTFDFYAKAVPYGNVNRQVYKGKITYKKEVLWVVPVTVVVTDVQKDAPASILPLDYYPGGFYSIPVELSEVIADIPLINWIDGLAEDIYLGDHFNFIPQTSALDIGRGAVSLTDADYLRQYVGGDPPPAPKDTPFHNFTSGFSNGANINEFHISFQQRNSNWLATELNEAPLNLNCGFFCDAIRNTISGNGFLCNASNYSVPVFGDAVVNWSVSDPNAVTLVTAGATATLTPVTGYRKAVTLIATISSNSCNRSAQVSKTLWVGAPATPPTLTGPTTVVTGALVNYQGSAAPGATSYQWFLPGAYQTVASYDYLGNQWQKLTTATTQAVQVFTGWGKYNGSVQVAGVNACGCGGARSLYVTHPSPAGGGGSGLQPAPGGGIPKFSEPGGGVKSQIDAPATDSLAVAGFELQQNSPNPFHQTTIIVAQLPESVQQATIVVYSTQGVALASYPLQERGKVSVEISGGRFPAGMYLYALVADGNVVDTKKMILTK